jgi:hypothetical protein
MNLSDCSAGSFNNSQRGNDSDKDQREEQKMMPLPTDKDGMLDPSKYKGGVKRHNSGCKSIRVLTLRAS